MNIPTHDEMVKALAYKDTLDSLNEAAASAGGGYQHQLEKMTLIDFLKSLAGNGIRFEFTNRDLAYYRSEGERAVEALKNLNAEKP